MGGKRQSSITNEEQDSIIDEMQDGIISEVKDSIKARTKQFIGEERDSIINALMLHSRNVMTNTGRLLNT
jgi:hypothetical protein